MACYHPLKAWRSREVTPSGKRKIVFTPREAYIDLFIQIPCGQCIGCRLEHSRQWAIRCVHEASQHEDNCFVTLTYDDAHLPADGSLDITHFQRFIKKLRRKYGSGIRYFHCGEYGENLSRPHYHAIIFNFDFPDRILYSVNNGHNLYNSAICDAFWEHKGFCVIGDVTFQSAAYVSRYILKKISGNSKDEHYQGLKPEYTSMSRRPGIGKSHFDKYHQEMYKDDFIIINGKKCRVPRYYDSQKELIDPDSISSLKISRQRNAEKRSENNTDSRLRVREKIQKLKRDRLIRPLETP